MKSDVAFYLTNPLTYVIMGSILCSLLGIGGFIMGLTALIQVKALQASTHSVQYMPIDPQIDKENEELMAGWGTSDEAISEQDKLFKEALEEEMPEFVPNEEDKKKYSF